MTVTYTGNLKFGLPTTGTESGVWGDVVNNQITTLVDQSISGTVSLTSMTNADYTLTNGNGNAANEARYMALLVPSSLTLTAARNIIVPSTSKMYLVKNSTTGGFSVTVKTSAGTGIAVPNGSEMMLYCDGTNVLTAFDTINVSTVNGGQIAGLRNKLINGNMNIAQRGTSFTANGNAYTLDRWTQFKNNTAVVDITQSTDVPSTLEFLNSLRLTVTTADAAVAIGETQSLFQPIEGYNARDLIGRAFTLSFWVRSSKTGVHCVSFANSGVDRSIVAEYTIIAANTWEKKSVTVAAGLITAGTWNWTNGSGVIAGFTLACGTTFQTTANVWQTGNFTGTASQVNCLDTIGNIFAITGVQLEVGTAASSFEQRSYGLELALCQRYYYEIMSPGLNSAYLPLVGYLMTATTLNTPFTMPVPMRTTPTLATSASADFVLYASGGAWVMTSVVKNGSIGSGISITWTSGTSGATATDVGLVYTNGTTARLALVAEI